MTKLFTLSEGSVINVKYVTSISKCEKVAEDRYRFRIWLIGENYEGNCACITAYNTEKEAKEAREQLMAMINDNFVYYSPRPEITEKKICKKASKKKTK